MSDFKDLVGGRRTHRLYKEEELSEDDVQLILRAALYAPSGHGRRNWQFVVVEDKADLEKLADCKESGAAFLKGAALAVAVLCDPQANECWREDCSIAAVTMQYQAEDLGIGSCWVQIAERYLSDGTPAEQVVRGILDIPEQMRCLCIVGFGKKKLNLLPNEEDALKWENVHLGKF